MSGITIDTPDNASTRFTFENGSLTVILRHGDLSVEHCDAVVNSTNNSMVPNGGFDAIIHQKMGNFFSQQVFAVHQQLLDASCPTGQSRIFSATLDKEPSGARFVINTVGPVYTVEEKKQAAFNLQSCYCTSLALANLYQLTSIAYPAMSCGQNDYPPNEAAQVGIESVRQFSYNVKDVRFVLFDINVYNAFVHEWTAYAQRVNDEANVTAQSTQAPPKQSLIPPPVPPKPNFQRCILCKEQPLPPDRTTLCVSCSGLGRVVVFENLLQRLRTAAAHSFEELEQECRILQPILSSYPLVYTPAQTFDQASHPRDQVAEHYLQHYCNKSYRYNYMPMAIIGDGNCLYNTFVKLAGVTTTSGADRLTSVELRARNILELVLNQKAYCEEYKYYTRTFDNFQDYVRSEMVHDRNYAAVWDILSLPTILHIQLTTVYPKVNSGDDITQSLWNNATFRPLESSDTTNQQPTRLSAVVHYGVKLLFSHCNKPTTNAKNTYGWTPNHFVPILNLK